MSMGFFCNMVKGNVILICVLGGSWEICWMIYKFSISAKLGVNIPQFNWQLMHNIFDIAGSSFSCSMVFYMKVVYVALYTGNPVTSSPF